MTRIALFLAGAVISAAQIIPNRYIIQLETEPAAAVSIAKRARFSPSDAAVLARRAQLQAEHTLVENAVRGSGGTVTHHFDTVLNGMAATMTPVAAQQMRQMANVKGVYPVERHHKLMDQAILVHRFPQAYQTLPGGAASAGAGVKIGIFDCGVDIAHPAFQGFSTTPPAGYPVISGTAVASNVNNKIIIARVYSDIAGGLDNSQTDALDYCDHGTTVAGIAAGLSTTTGFGTLGPIAGVAPGAWIANYKVADDYGNSDDVTFLAALNDAFNDGVQVVNYSYGGPIYNMSDETGPDAQAIATAVAGGMLVVAAVGNAGPSVGSVGTPAASPAAIAVGAMQNQRWFWFSAIVGGQPFYAIPAGEELGNQSGDTTGALVDISTLTSDTGGYGCSALPAGSLTNNIALIQRGGPGGVACPFATKLNNASTAGAIGAVVYDNRAETMFDYTLSGGDVSGFALGLSGVPADASGAARVVTWSMGSAALPAVLVSQADGQSIQQLVAANPGMVVDIDFDGKTALPYPANVLSDFSSAGPTPGANIKPDMVAVGDYLVAPVTTQYETVGCPTPFSLDLNLGCYPPYSFLDSPFQLDFAYQFGYGAYFDDGAGTSFATPMVTGAAAILMAARPGLTGAQYRSLVTGSAPEFDAYPAGTVSAPQIAGGGKLDMLGILQSGVASSVTSLNFLPPAVTTGGGASSTNVPSSSVRGGVAPASLKPAALVAHDATAAPAGVTQTFTLTNTGAATDTFTITVQSLDGIASPTFNSSSFALAAGASQTVTATLPGATLAPGQYHGFLLVNGTQGQTTLRLPYWYGVPGTSAQNALVLYNPGVDPSACTDYIDFRVQDAIGLPFEPVANPTVTTANTRAQGVKVYPLGDVSGTFEAQVVTGRADANGNNTFTIAVGSTTLTTVVIAIDNSGATGCGGGTAAVGTNSLTSVSLKSKGKSKSSPKRQAGSPGFPVQ